MISHTRIEETHTHTHTHTHLQVTHTHTHTHTMTTTTTTATATMTTIESGTYDERSPSENGGCGKSRTRTQKHTDCEGWRSAESSLASGATQKSFDALPA